MKLDSEKQRNLLLKLIPMVQVQGDVQGIRGALKQIDALEEDIRNAGIESSATPKPALVPDEDDG